MATVANLACGLWALVFVARATAAGEPDLLSRAAWLLVVAMCLDAVDGKLARLTRSTSEFGAQLDSLADMVTFGVVPAFVIRALGLIEGPRMDISLHPQIWVVAPIIYGCCAALRLARFNVEHAQEDPKRDHSMFVGLPSPAAAALPISLTLFYFAVADTNFPFAATTVSPQFIDFVRSSTVRIAPFLLIALGMLMVTRLPFPHFVAWATRVRNPFQRLAEFVVIFGLLLVEKELALLLLSVLFIAFPAVLGVVRVVRRRLFHHRPAA